MAQAPAFQFYPKEFLSSSKVIAMTATERGIYITLLSMQWLDGSLPNDLPALARLAGVNTRAFIRMWPHNLARCFTLTDGRLVNERLERERVKQAEYRRRQSDRSAQAWQRRRDGLVMASHPSANALQSASAISDLQSAEELKTSAEPPSDSTPTICEFPTVGRVQRWPLTQGRVDAWAQSYPNVDVPGECRKAFTWIEANPERRKTAKGMPAFLVNWLNRAVNRGTGSTPPAGRGPVWLQNVRAKQAQS